MWSLISKIIENWQTFFVLVILIGILLISGALTKLIRSIKDSLKELFTPLGIVIMGIVLVVGIVLYSMIK